MSQFEVLDDLREERLEAKRKRLVHGSAITIIFTPNWLEVVLGWSKKPLVDRGQVWKCACGQAEIIDVPDTLTAESTNMQFAQCARRERINETGLHDERFLFVEPLSYVRHSRSPNVGPLQQWHFVGWLKERYELPTNPIESFEMGDPTYWLVTKALRLPTKSRPIPQEMKVNPYHQIAIARCLIELRDAKIGDDPNFGCFGKVLGEIYDAGINLDTYERDVKALIAQKLI